MLKPNAIEVGDRIWMEEFGYSEYWEITAPGEQVAGSPLVTFVVTTSSGSKVLRLAADVEWIVNRLPRKGRRKR